MKKIFFVFLLTMSSAKAALMLNKTLTNANVEFEAVGRPSMIKIKGQGTGLKSNLQLSAENKLSGEVEFELSTLKTGIDLRDEHMLQKYLEVGKYPKAVLKLNQLALPNNFENGVTSGNLTAKMSLHGIEKTINGVYDISKENLSVSASFDLNISDFNIAIPSYLGIKVTEVVKVRVIIPSLK